MPVKYGFFRSQAFWEREWGKVQKHSDFIALVVPAVFAFPSGSGNLGMVVHWKKRTALAVEDDY